MKWLRATPLLLVLWAPIAPAATMTIVNADDPGEGLNDPTATTPDQGVPGLTLGEARQQAMQAAADYWGARLGSSVEVRIEVDFQALPCNSNTGQLGSAGSNFIFQRPGPNGETTFYPAALADALRGSDNLPGEPDVTAIFNKSVDDGDSCLPGKWYYGTDGNNGGNPDFVETVKHELAHGLGFSSFTDSDGSYADNATPGIWDHFTFDESRGANWVDLTQSQRASSYTNDQNVTWSGAAVTSVGPQFSAGVHASGRIKLYAPNPVELGSSISHWDSSLAPDAIMEPVTDGSGEIVEIATCLLRDIGWSIIGGDVCTGSVTTPTPTPTAGPTPTPAPTTTPSPTPASNLPPTIGNLSDRTTSEDNLVTFSVSLSDDNTPVPQLAVTGESSNSGLIDTSGIAIELTSSGATIALQPLADASGNATITLRVVDAGGLSTSGSFTFTVNPVNDAPTIAAIAPQTGDEDQPLDVLIAVDDVDSALAALTVSAATQDDSLLTRLSVSGTGNTRTVSLTPASDASGTATVTITADDGERTATRSFGVTILPVNDPPVVVTQVQTRLVNAGEAVNIDLSDNFDDVDGDSLLYTATGLPDGLTLEDTSGRITGTVAADQAGNSPFTVQATANDPSGETASLSFDLIVAVDAIDVALELDYEADRFEVGEPLRFTLMASNLGSRTASQLSLLVKLDGVGLGTPALPGGCSAAASQPPFVIDCALDTLGADARRTLTFSAPTSAATDVLVDAEITHADEDSVPANNVSLRATRVVAAAATTGGRALGTGDVSALAAADLDDDGQLDLILATGPAEPVRALFSAGTANPALVTLGGSADHTAATAADVDGDGRLDVVTGTRSGLVQIFTNLGARNFRLQSTVAEGAIVGLAAADLDGDGAADIAALQTGRLEIIDGSLRRVITRLDVADARAVTAGDLNGDGLAELIVAAAPGNTLVLRNIGALNFEPALTFDSGDSQAVAASDINGDVQLDLVFANLITRNASTAKLLAESASNRAYLGNGNLGLTELQRLGTLNSVGVGIADVDGDADADIVFATGEGGLALFRNSGGGFSPDTSDLLGGAAYAVITPDLDGDGDADLVAIGDQAGVKALFNRGDGTFSAAGAPTPTPTPSATPTPTVTPTPTATPSPTPGDSGGGGSGRLGAVLALLLLAALRQRRTHSRLKPLLQPEPQRRRLG